MKTSGQFQKKASTQSAPIPLSTNLFHRPFPKRSATTEEASTDSPDFQARLEFARSHAPNLNSLAANSSGDRPSTIQPKLTIGQPNDQYEQEADRVADQVMSMPDATTPQTVQREAMPEEVQMKPLLPRLPDGNLQADEGVESRLNQSKGGGSPLSDEVRSFMEPRFGADFSQVRTHTGSTSIQMNQELGAQAFAHGSNIYFGAGKSPANSHLTAHELTHIVQQTGKGNEAVHEQTQGSGMPAANQNMYYSISQPDSISQTTVQRDLTDEEYKGGARGSSGSSPEDMTSENSSLVTGAGGASGVEADVYKGGARGSSGSSPEDVTSENSSLSFSKDQLIDYSLKTAGFAAGFIPGGVGKSITAGLKAAKTLEAGAKDDTDTALLSGTQAATSVVGGAAQLGGYSFLGAGGLGGASSAISEGGIGILGTVGGIEGSMATMPGTIATLAGEGLSGAAALGPAAGVAGAGLAGFAAGKALSGPAAKGAFALDKLVNGVSDKPIENADGSFSPNDSYKKTWGYKINQWLEN